jgi:hypothetical protein
VVPPNEFSPFLPNNGRGVSWRFFLNRNSQACRHGVTSTAMVYSGKNQGGVRIARDVALNFSFSPSLQPFSFYICLYVIIIKQEIYGMCANNFQDVSLAILLLRVHFHFVFLHPCVICMILVLQWGVSLFRFGNENRCDAA